MVGGPLTVRLGYRCPCACDGCTLGAIDRGEIGDNRQIIIALSATMNRLDAMNLFVRVADLGSFAAVANQLGVARSVVTRQIAALEEHLGVKLMVRATRKLTLTSAGTSYLDKCRTILDLVEVAEADVMEARLTPRGNLRIGLPLSYGLKRVAPLLPAFQKNLSRDQPSAGLHRPPHQPDRRGHRPVDPHHAPARRRRRRAQARREPPDRRRPRPTTSRATAIPRIPPSSRITSAWAIRPRPTTARWPS